MDVRAQKERKEWVIRGLSLVSLAALFLLTALWLPEEAGLPSEQPTHTISSLKELPRILSKLEKEK